MILEAQTAAILRKDNIDMMTQYKIKNLMDFLKDNPGADEIDYHSIKRCNFDDGRYVIGGRLVEKKGNQVAFIV